MRHERDMVRAIVRGGAFVPGLVFGDAELAAIEQPVLHVVGTADPVGTVAVWRRMSEVLRRGELDLVEGAGHVPWLGDPRAGGAPCGRVPRVIRDDPRHDRARARRRRPPPVRAARRG